MDLKSDVRSFQRIANAVYDSGADRLSAIVPVRSETSPLDDSQANALAFGETEGILCSLARMVEQRDLHTAGHCERLSASGVALGVAMRLDIPSLRALYIGGYLHDIGKMGIPDSILFKPDSLNAEEWEVMRAHPVHGEEICRPMKSLAAVLPMIRHHHERWDGSGYPDGLRGNAIPLLARVLQVVDIYDALTNPRPYKHAYSSARALDILREETDRGWRDKEITALFIQSHPRQLNQIAETHLISAGLSGIADSLRNLQALALH